MCILLALQCQPAYSTAVETWRRHIKKRLTTGRDSSEEMLLITGRDNGSHYLDFMLDYVLYFVFFLSPVVAPWELPTPFLVVPCQKLSQTCGKLSGFGSNQFGQGFIHKRMGDLGILLGISFLFILFLGRLILLNILTLSLCFCCLCESLSE